MTAVNTEERIGVVRLTLWSGGYALRRWRGMVGVIAMTLLNIAIGLAKPWPMKVLVDRVFNGRVLHGTLAQIVNLLPGASNRENLLTWLVIGTVCIFVASWIVGVGSAYANLAFGQRMSYDLATDLFRHMEHLSLRFHQRHPVGDSMRRVTVDSSCVSTIVTGTLLPLVSSLITLVTIFWIMWTMDHTLLLLALMVVPFMALVTRRYARPMFQRSYQQQEISGQQFSLVERTLSAITVVKAFTGEQNADDRLRATNAGMLRATLATTTVQMQFKILLGLATALGTAAIIWVGAHDVLAGRLTIGSLLVFLAYLGTLYDPVHALAYVSSTAQSAGGSIRRVLQILDTEPEVKEEAGATRLEAVKGHVQFDGITFGYEPDRPVLRDIS
ncbi:MAG TPA: ABC transporter transmembrane domain-containing protein, partial [Chloroflexota bacterium]